MARKLASESGGSDSSIESEESSGERDETDGSGRTLKRRDCMELGATAAGAVLGASGLASATEERGGIRFDRVVDAVDDLGMDPTGSDPIDGALQDAHETGTLIEFPPGEYKIKTEAVISGSTSRWGIRGAGESHKDVTFRFPNADNSYWFVHQHGGEDVLLDNFTLDSNDKLIGIRIRTNDGGLIRDVEWAGYLPERDGWPGQLLDPGCRDRDGVNRVVRTIMGRDGSFVHGHSWATDRTGITGIRFYPYSDTHGERHAGETILEDIEIHQLSSNGVRNTHPKGVVTVEGGFFKNCHLAHLRIHAGDHPTKQSSVTGATMIIDHDDHLPMGDGEWNEHGCNAVMLDSTSKSYSQAIYEDCDIICRNVEPTDGWGLIRCNNTGSSSPGGGVFRNCRITNDTELQTIWIDERESGVDEPRHWLFENCEITVAAPDQYQEAAFVLRDDWDGSEIRNCSIYAPNGDVDGVFIENTDDVTIEDSTIDVSGRATVFENADVTTTNVSQDVSKDTDSSLSGDEDSFEEDPSLLRVIADDDADVFEYSFTVDGRIEHATDGDYPSNPDASSPDVITANDDGTYTVEGVVAGYAGDDKRWGGDSYRITGAIVSIYLEGPADVLLDGEIVDPDDYGLPNRLTIVGTGTSSSYDFTVDGELTADPNGSRDGDFEVSGSSVEGTVAEGVDSFRFDGQINYFQFDGEAGVYLNGQQVEPSLLDTDEDPALRNWIQLEGDGDVTEYAFSVSGHVRKSPDLGPVEPDDVIQGSTIEGTISEATDGYRFNGDLESLDVRGTADLRFNDN